tara:strand:- start:37 stop:324 length:288 start_codon:yes stop_codon:yes gene_type:complete
MSDTIKLFKLAQKEIVKQLTSIESELAGKRLELKREGFANTGILRANIAHICKKRNEWGQKQATLRHYMMTYPTMNKEEVSDMKRKINWDWGYRL